MEGLVSRGKDAKGEWDPWEGLTSGRGGIESDLYQAGWFVPQDVPGLISLVGGKETFVAKLSDFFDRTPKLNKWNSYEQPAERAEPSHSLPLQPRRRAVPDSKMD